MTIACKLTLNSQVLYPELPITRRAILVRKTLDLQNGNERKIHQKTRYEWPGVTIRDVDETIKATWHTAAATATSVTFTDETSTSYTCSIEELETTLTRTTPAIEGGTNTTGPGFYDVIVTIRQIE